MPTPRRAPSTDRLDEVADELYGLAPERFVAARNDHEKTARRAGDRELAAGIHALAKPNLTAWLANQVARQRRDELQPLLELGAGLREATARLAGDELRQLSRQQRELVSALVRQARQLAEAAGHPVSEATAHGLADTLHAALADEHAAQQLLAGRLTEALHRSGLGDTAMSDAGAARAHPTARGRAAERGRAAASGSRRKGRDDHQRHRAETDRAEARRALDEAERVLAGATRSRDAARAEATEADDAASAAAEDVERLRRQLTRAGTDASDAATRRRETATALRRAERAVGDAERRRTEAQQRRDRLGRG